MTLVRSRAPLRLGLGGGGSDVSPYCDLHGGAVLNATINLGAYCTIEHTDGDSVVFLASDSGERVASPPLDRFEYDGNLDLHKGVYNRVVSEFNHGQPLSLKVTTYCDAPPGSGLGSSSTLVVAMLTAYAELLTLPLGKYDIARMSFEIERSDIGLLGGRQDQYAATFGGVNFLEFHAENRVIVNPLRIKGWVMNELEMSTVLYFLGASRESAKIIQEQTKNFATKDLKSLEAVHQLKRDAVEMKDALIRGEIAHFAEILAHSWRAKQDLASSISNPVIEAVIDTAQSAGAISGKVSGAGGGGFVMLLVDPVDRMGLIRELNKLDGYVTPFHFSDVGADAWTI